MMHAALKIAGFGMLLMIIAYLIVSVWTARVVKENIAIAKSNYPGNAEEAFLAMLKDDSVSSEDKTHIAVWSLGQLRSEKALPVLKALYKDDPEGISCYGKHKFEICQYELHKAIEAIEGKMLLSFAYLNK